MTDYKDLNIDREAIGTYIATFLEVNSLTQDGELEVVGKAQRITFGVAGSKFAMVDLYLNKAGTTTIVYKNRCESCILMQ